MANPQLFASAKASQLPSNPIPLGQVPSNGLNQEGAPAYLFNPQHQLAQYAATGCLNATWYASADQQLATVLELSQQVDARFIAQTAIYCRERGYMKDMPALLTAILAQQVGTQVETQVSTKLSTQLSTQMGTPMSSKASAIDPAALLSRTFSRTINNGKMLRNFVQILRSGAVGRTSLGTRPKKLVQNWLNCASEKELLAASIGTAPSLADVVKMVHPKPTEAWRAAFFAWLIGKPYDVAALPPRLQAFEAYKQERSQPLPDVPFQMLTALNLSSADWAQIARQGSWHMVRMNLNTFARHGVFEIAGMEQIIADKLCDTQAIAKAGVFPYQIMAALWATNCNVPDSIDHALERALEMSLQHVPQIAGRVVVCPDVSGSMSGPVSGMRSTSSSIRCIDVAALVTAAMLRKNPGTIVLPFENQVVACLLDESDSVASNAKKLAAIGGGGTNCSAPLARLNQLQRQAELVIYVSDNESWIDARRHGSSATMQEWAKFKRSNPEAKLVCIDITPNSSTQAMEQPDVLNIGGFSDDVFKIIAAFAAGQLGSEHWIGEIAAVDI